MLLQVIAAILIGFVIAAVIMFYPLSARKVTRVHVPFYRIPGRTIIIAAAMVVLFLYSDCPFGRPLLLLLLLMQGW